MKTAKCPKCGAKITMRQKSAFHAVKLYCGKKKCCYEKSLIPQYVLIFAIMQWNAHVKGVKHKARMSKCETSTQIQGANHARKSSTGRQSHPVVT